MSKPLCFGGPLSHFVFRISFPSDATVFVSRSQCPGRIGRGSFGLRRSRDRHSPDRATALHPNSDRSDGHGGANYRQKAVGYCPARANAEPEDSAQSAPHFHRAARPLAYSWDDTGRGIVDPGKTAQAIASTTNDAHVASSIGGRPKFFASSARVF